MKKKKKSIKNARIVSKKRYSQLIKKKKTKKRMTKRDKKDLDKALFVNYCKCIKRLKYSKEYEDGLEYPICMSSVYKKRGFKPPKNISKKCKQYI
tara:strand:+ start:14438 stop:14722 length:285 start_codon:yes stop_codon:yes gene_type:complete